MNSAINGAHIYTRAELNALDKFKQGASLRQIAEELGVSDGAVTNWLRSLGMYRKQRKPTKPRTREAKCPRCGILLTAAPPGDGTRCGWCIEETAASKVVDDTEWKQVH